MNELNLSISTGKENNKVVLTAAFETHLEAVRFHAAVADLCEKANNSGRAIAVSNPTFGRKVLAALANERP